MKTTFTIAFFTLFIFFNIQAQDKKFSFGLNLFPNVSDVIITNDGTAPDEQLDFYKEDEIPKLSFSGGFFVEYLLSPKSSIGIGLGYQNTGGKTKSTQLIFASDIDPSIGFTNNSGTEVQFIYNHHNIEIPLYYKFNFTKKFYLLTGTSGIINLYNTTTSVFYTTDSPIERNTEEDKESSYRDFNISTNIGFGYNYLNKENFLLFVQPSFQYGILGLTKNTPLNRNYFSIGISTGIKIL
jgi:hypothetical protein